MDKLVGKEKNIKGVKMVQLGAAHIECMKSISQRQLQYLFNMNAVSTSYMKFLNEYFNVNYISYFIFYPLHFIYCILCDYGQKPIYKLSGNTQSSKECCCEDVGQHAKLQLFICGILYFGSCSLALQIYHKILDV